MHKGNFFINLKNHLRGWNIPHTAKPCRFFSHFQFSDFWHWIHFQELNSTQIFSPHHYLKLIVIQNMQKQNSPFCIYVSKSYVWYIGHENGGWGDYRLFHCWISYSYFLCVNCVTFLWYVRTYRYIQDWEFYFHKTS